MNIAAHSAGNLFENGDVKGNAFRHLLIQNFFSLAVFGGFLVGETSKNDL
jgi:hypothetical protein